jgi:putative membrane protein
MTGAVDVATSALVTSMLTDAHAVALLHESNLAEIQAGTLAQREARDSAVRAFATMMVNDHGALDQRASALAQQVGVTPALPDSQLPRLQATEAAALPTPGGAATGASPFDSAYVAQQVAAHTRTLALVDAAIGRAQAAELRTMLQTEVRPRVVAHLDAARQLQQRLGGR